MKIAYLDTTGVILYESFWQQVYGLADLGVSIDIVVANTVGIPKDIIPSGYPSITIRIVSEKRDVVRKKTESFILNNKVLRIIASLINLNIKRLTFGASLLCIKDVEEFLKKTYISKDMLAIEVEDYDYVIACDDISLYWASILIQECEKPKLIYHSYELYWETRYNPWKTPNAQHYLLYKRCRELISKLYLIVIQDENRWNSLCKYTGLDTQAKHFCWPISEGDRTIKGWLEYNTESVDRNEGISILYQTSILKRRKAIVLARSMEGMRDVCLRIHGAYGEDYTIEELRRYCNAHPDITYTSNFVTNEDIAKMVDQSSIVFLYYGEEDDNNRFICHSSNKLALALERGKPIIVTGNRLMGKMCEDMGCGVYIDGFKSSEIRRAINTIRDDYECYCKSARALFKREYDSSIYVMPFYDMLSRNQ